MTLDELASRLEGVRRKEISGRGPGLRAKCPAHQDDHPSFAAWEGADGWLHFKCQRGCSEGAIMQALGMGMLDRRALASDGGGQCLYKYTDASGAYLFEKVRITDRLGRKTFFQRIACPGGEYQTSILGLGAQAKTLYRIAEVCEAVRLGLPVYVNEGEKSVEALRRKGHVATCQPSGAGNGKWLEQHTTALRGAHVVIVADRDDAGGAYAKEVYSALEPVAKTIKVVRSKTRGEHDDAYDHLQAGFGVDDFDAASDLMEVSIAGMVTFAKGDFAPFEVDFLWEPYLFFGQACLLIADSGVGKSTLLLAFAAGMSKGQLPNSGGSCHPVKTAYFIGDSDPAESYETMFRANGGVPEMVTWIKGLRPLDGSFKSDVRKLARAGHRLIIIDPLMNYMALTKNDSNDGLQATDAFGNIADVAEECGVCILVAHHTGKGADRKSASEVHLGSVMLKARSRGYLYGRKSPGDKGLVIVTDEKGSLASPRGEAFAYRRVGNEVLYVTEFDNPFDSEGTAPKSKGFNCREWIIDMLTDQWTPSKVLSARAKDAGFSERTFERARTELVKELKILKGGTSENTVFCLAVDQPPYDLWGDQ